MAREAKEVRFRGPDFGGGLIINLAIIATVLIILVLMAVGYFIGNQIAVTSFGRVDPMAAHIAGAIAGLIIGVPLAGVIELLSQIEKNTRYTAAMFERLVANMQRE